MQDNDKKDFAAVMTGLAENYGQTLTPQGIALRFEALKQFKISEIRAAALAIMAGRKYTNMPTVADFLEYLGGGAAEDIAEVEAGKVIRAMSEHGAYRSVVFDNPVTQAVINDVWGGWPKVCEMCPDKWLRHEFVKVFAAYARQGRKQFGHLPGLIELNNAAAGLSEFIQPPVLVGNQQQALAVLQYAEEQTALAQIVQQSALLALEEGAMQ